MTWRMRFECWIPKAAETNSEYVILIVFPRQQRLQERTSMLRHTHIASMFVVEIVKSVRSEVLTAVLLTILHFFNMTLLKTEKWHYDSMKRRELLDQRHSVTSHKSLG
jgi:hypothetical protein